MSEPVTVTEDASYDSARRRRATRYGRQRGVYVYLPASELRRAGIDPANPPPWYRTLGYRRSKKGRTVIVTLYDEP